MKRHILPAALAILLTGCGQGDSVQAVNDETTAVRETVTAVSSVTDTDAVTTALTSSTAKSTAANTAKSTAAGTVTTAGTTLSAAETSSGTTAEPDEPETAEPVTETEPPETTRTTSAATVKKRVTTAATKKTTAKTTVSATTAATSETTAETVTEYIDNAEYRDYDLTDCGGILQNTLFIGDSIITGMRFVEIVPMDHVAALVGLGVRHVMETVFNVDGTEMDAVTAAETIQPAHIVCSFGLNDINLISEEEFLSLYGVLLEAVHEAAPDADVNVLSITPVHCTNQKFSNKKIDRYNVALKAWAEDSSIWHYIDVTAELKDPQNGLKTRYHRGDGLHLSNEAYYPFLWQIIRGIEGN